MMIYQLPAVSEYMLISTTSAYDNYSIPDIIYNLPFRCRSTIAETMNCYNRWV